MFVNERFIKVPYQEYKVSIKHAAIRKLTVIEWSLLRIVNQFGAQAKYNDFTLERFYEEILGMDNCEMLLKPCVHQLIDLGLIEIEGFTETSMVVRFKLSDIKITEKGSKSFSDGYLLGQMQNADETAYLDIVLNEMLSSIQDYSDRDTDHRAKAINRGKANAIAFPTDRFIQEVNEGRLFKEKYYDSRRLVASAYCAEEKVQWYTTLLLLEQTKNNELRCNFPVNDEILDLLRKMVSCPFDSKDRAAEWDAYNPLPENGHFGSKMLRPIFSSLEYSENVFMPEELYNLVLSENPTLLNGKTVFIMGSREFAIDDLQGLIYLPFSFNNSNLIYCDDKKAAYDLFVKHGSLSEKLLDVYFILEDQGVPDCPSGLFSKATVLAEKSPEIISVFSMPVFKVQQIELNCLYSECLSNYNSFKEAIQFAARVSSTSRRLHGTVIKPEITSDYVLKLLPSDDVEALIANLRYAYQYFYNNYDHVAYLSLLLEAAMLYSGMDRIASTEMIMELAEAYCGGKYDKAAFRKLASEKVLPSLRADDYDARYSNVGLNNEQCRESLFAPYADYLAFREAYHTIIGLLPEFSWDNEYTKDDLLGKVIECSNILKVNECIDCMINVADNRTKLVCHFFRDNKIRKNADMLKEILSLFILPEGVPAPIYIIDTCAFMHTPDILDYFEENEIVRIPQKVLQELDKHKDSKNPDLHFPAAKACKSIENHNTKARLGGLLTFDLEPQDYPDLLPVGFNYTNNNRLSSDNLILSCAFRYKAFRPTILTDDTNFRNISRSQGIAVKAWKGFIEERGGKAERSSSASKPVVTGSVPTETTVAVPQKTVPVVSAQPKTDTVESDKFDAREKLRHEWLNRSVEDLSILEIGVSSKVIKALQAADIKTIKKLSETSDAAIRQKIKAVSLRTGAIDAKKKFEQYIAKVTIDESLVDEKRAQQQEEMIPKSSPLKTTDPVPEASESDVIDSSDNVPLTRMGLSIRTFNCLHRAGYSVSGEFIHLSNEQLLKIRNLGQNEIDEIHGWVTSQLNSTKVVPPEQARQPNTESVYEGERADIYLDTIYEKNEKSKLVEKWESLRNFAQALGMQPERMERSILFTKQLEEFVCIAEKENPKLAYEIKSRCGMDELVDILDRVKFD